MRSETPGIKLVLLLVVLLGVPAAFYAWVRSATLQPSHQMCVAQAEHRLELDFGSLQAMAAEERDHPDDYRSLRTSMITTCEQHWSRSYVECLIAAPSAAAVEACESVGRVRSH